VEQVVKRRDSIVVGLTSYAKGSDIAWDNVFA